MSQAKHTPDEWGELYQARRLTHVGFTDALKTLLRQLLDEAAIPYAQVEGRAKDVPNFVSKLKRKAGKYADPLSEVTDLAGLRIVLFYLDDVERAGELIDQQFRVDPMHSGDKSAALDPDRFGYLSVHHVVRLSPSRSELLEWRRFEGLCAEIQVRTVLQHAWAAISRKLAYASVREAPRDLQRNLNRLSALLELADDEFVDIRNARAEIEADYDREVERGNLDLEIDESSLDVYLREAGVRDRVAQLARDAGSPPMDVKVQFFSQDTVEQAARGYRKRLLSAIEDAELDRISELDDLLSGLWPKLPEFMRTINDGYRDADGAPIGDEPDNWLTLIIPWSQRAPREAYEDAEWLEELVDVVVSTYD